MQGDGGSSKSDSALPLKLVAYAILSASILPLLIIPLHSGLDAASINWGVVSSSLVASGTLCLAGVTTLSLVHNKEEVKVQEERLANLRVQTKQPLVKSVIQGTLQPALARVDRNLGRLSSSGRYLGWELREPPREKEGNATDLEQPIDPDTLFPTTRTLLEETSVDIVRECSEYSEKITGFEKEFDALYQEFTTPLKKELREGRLGRLLEEHDERAYKPDSVSDEEWLFRKIIHRGEWVDIPNELATPRPELTLQGHEGNYSGLIDLDVYGLREDVESFLEKEEELIEASEELGDSLEKAIEELSDEYELPKPDELQ